jgi:hypothetical protein
MLVNVDPILSAHNDEGGAIAPPSCPTSGLNPYGPVITLALQIA